MSLSLANEQDALPVDEERLLGDVATLAASAGWRGSLSLALVSDRAMRELNRRFLGRDETTDVLAFPLDDGEAEIVVSAERAAEMAAELGVDPRAELLLYVVHGLLHVLGHDDRDPESARRMHARSLKLLRGIGCRNRIAFREREGSPD